MIPLEMRFLFRCEPVKADTLCASKIREWDSQRIDILIPKGRGKNKEGKSDRCLISLKHSKANSIRSES